MFKSQPKFHRLEEVPEPSMGAPIPMIIGDEHELVLCYYIQSTHSDWDGTNPRLVGKSSIENEVAIIKFSNVTNSRFGPPDEDDITTNPVYGEVFKKGYYWAFIIEGSEGISNFANHNKGKHYFFTFHDSSFEIITKSYSVKIVKDCSVLGALQNQIDCWSK